MLGGRRSLPGGASTGVTSLCAVTEIEPLGVKPWRGTVQLTAGEDYHPAWSPDGRRIAFEGSTNGIYVVNADGSGQRMLARRGSDPAWSPDGRTIAFMWRFHIYVMNADGTEHRALMRLWNGKRASLAWSPDGRKLAFLAGGGPVVDDLLRGGCGAPPVYCFNLYVVNSDGSGLRNLTSKLAGQGFGAGLASDPVWSPDGRKIAFLSKRDGNWEVYVINVAGRDDSMNIASVLGHRHRFR
jgi:Tol biopolymer transport system component